LAVESFITKQQKLRKEVFMSDVDLHLLMYGINQNTFDVMIIKKITVLCLLLIGAVSASLSGEKPFPDTKAYKLDLKIDFVSEKLYGKCVIELKNGTAKPFAKVPILLYRLLTIRSVENVEHEPLKFIQEIKSVEGFEKLQVNYTEIFLPNALMPGEEIKINIVYDGYLLGYAGEGWRYVKDHIDRSFTILRTDGFSYPVVGFATDQEMMAIVNERYTFEINVTIQNGLNAVTGGELLSKTQDTFETTFKFRSKKPSWRIDIIITDYLTFDKGRNRVYYFKNHSSGALAMLNALDKSLNLYSEWFGAIDDFQGYSIIEVPEGYSSQQDITAIYITADNFRKPEEMLIIYHEISHLWNVKSLDPQPCRFESEGLAQFLEFLMSEKLENKRDLVMETAQQYLDKIRKIYAENPEYQKIPIKDYGIKDMTDYSYTLGMVVFAAYYNLVGLENFNKMLKSFFSAFSENGATLDEFINHCKKTATVDLEKFFDDWIYSTNGVKLLMAGNRFEDIIQYYSATRRDSVRVGF
jgi:aminopeptidase N